MSKKRMKAAIYRSCEMLMWCLALSVVICILCVSGPMPVGSLQRDVGLIAAPIAFLIFNFISLRTCYVALRGKKSYYIINLCAYAIFSAISLSIYFLCHPDVYTWLFVVTRFARYSSLGISSPIAIGICHFFLILSIFIAPVGMGWVQKRREERRALRKAAPGFLKVNNNVVSKENKTAIADNTEVRLNENEREKDSLS